jgi:hypothetical protein
VGGGDELKFTGLDELIANTKRLRDTLVRNVAEATAESGDELLQDVRASTSHPMQEVPSYIYETESLGKHGGPGKYPPETIGHFARRSPRIDGTPWEGQTQRYDDGSPLLSTAVELEHLEKDGQIRAVVGYDDALASKQLHEHSALDVLIWTLYGTVFEQPRPFLQTALARRATDYLQRVRDAVVKTLQEFR